MQGLAFPIAPIIGQVFKGFAYTRQGWTKAKPSTRATWSNVQRFTANGRYIPSDDLVYVIVECWGAGGGGGWATGDLEGVTITPTAAGGGGSGGYSKSTIPAELVSQGADVVIGVGGIVGVGTPGGGNTATVTSFGGLVVANGGGDAQAFDGTATIAAAHGLPGMGAPIGAGDIAAPGAAGGMWGTIIINLAAQHLTGAAPGLGGQLIGGAQWPLPPWLYTNSNGRDGVANTGAGGGGAQVNTGSTAVTTFGGRGGSGLCVVTEICSTDTESPGPGPGPVEPPGWPPGVPHRVDLRARVVHDPYGLHVEPVEGK